MFIIVDLYFQQIRMIINSFNDTFNEIMKQKKAFIFL
jgi:hypothetical protein